MPIENHPRSRHHLSIPRKAKVVEVGSGHNPHPAANTIVDKFLDTNFHRSGDAKVLAHQTFLQADGQKLPFKHHEFDYAISCHVLEHVEEPAAFLEEQFRIAPRGYLETPSLIGEVLYARESHRWLQQVIDGTLYVVDKKLVNFEVRYNLMELIQDYLPKHPVGFKILERTHPNLQTVRIQWQGNFPYVINPTDPQILQYFSGHWREEWSDKFFPEKSALRDVADSLLALFSISGSVLRSRLQKGVEPKKVLKKRAEDLAE